VGSERGASAAAPGGFRRGLRVVGAGSGRDPRCCSAFCGSGLRPRSLPSSGGFFGGNSVSAWRPSHFSLSGQREVTKRKATPRPRRPRIRRSRFPAVLAGSRPLRNSRIHALGHARFPLDPAPLLGAPEGPRVPSTRRPAWISDEFVPQDLRAGYRSGATATSEATARSKATARTRGVGHVVRAADYVTMLRCHVGPAGQRDLHALLAANASLSTLTEHLEPESRLEDQAGRRVEGKMGSPVERRGAERLAGESEHVRAQGCPSCAAACKARAPQGTPGARCTRGAEVGCLLSWLPLSGQAERSDSAAGRNALILKQEAKAKRSRAEPVPTGSRAEPRAGARQSRPRAHA
jgi:hypothetical protein